MYKLYEKVPKTEKYLYGSKEIEENENPFKDGPCLLCISGQYENKYAVKSNFGLTKEGMKMARLRVRQQKNAGFDLKEFPAKFLSIDLDKKNEEKTATEKERANDFVERYMIPLFSQNGEKIDVLQAMKNVRNINIMSYCDGTNLAQNIERNMIEKMKQLGYKDEECEKIQSQMCIIALSTNRLDGTQKSTCISFGDINDVEVNDNITEEEKSIVHRGINIFKFSDNEKAILYNGKGDHTVKKYTDPENAISVCVSSVITKILENSIINSSNEKFEPIKSAEIVSDIDRILEESRNGKSAEALMSELDKNIEYKDARKISDYEAKWLDKLDEKYDELIEMKKSLKYINDKLESKESKNNQMQYISESKKENEIESKYFKKGEDLEL